MYFEKLGTKKGCFEKWKVISNESDINGVWNRPLIQLFICHLLGSFSIGYEYVAVSSPIEGMTLLNYYTLPEKD
jgi:hypothetical protein